MQWFMARMRDLMSGPEGNDWLPRRRSGPGAAKVHGTELDGSGNAHFWGIWGSSMAKCFDKERSASRVMLAPP